MNKDYFIKVLKEWNGLIQSIEKDKKEDLYIRAKSKNGWFTSNFIDLAFKGLDNYLSPDNLEKWLDSFEVPGNINHPKKVGIVMAGNIPMVGFHDLLCVMAKGHRAMVKLSSQDAVLIPYIIELLFEIDPGFKNKINLVERLEKPEAVIATGSNNSARYFNYYFRHVPHIIRKNRTSIGILNGTESTEVLFELGKDILNYHGLGCRSVSKIYVPTEYDFDTFFKSIQAHEYIFETNKYVNNYDYNKSIFLVNREKFLDNGFLLLKESSGLVSPVSVLFYEHYKSSSDLAQLIHTNSENIQCITSDNCWYGKSINFGTTQMPNLWDYADDVNTIEFLNGI